MMGESYLLHHLLDNQPSASDKQAVVHGSESWTYKEFTDAVERVASWLVDRGVEHGDRIAVLLPKSYSECVAIFAASRADAVFVPINTILMSEQVRYILRDCGATALITSAEIAAQYAEKDDTLPDLRFVGVASEIMERPKGIQAPQPKALGEDLAAILYTSGSTGAPKGVMLSHRNLLAGARIVRTYLSITASDRLMSVLPFSFDYGLNQLTTSVEQGATIILKTFKLGNELVATLRDEAITGFALVPALWSILARGAPKLSTTPLPNLRYITNSGGAIPSASVSRMRKLLPNTNIFLMYGLTEAFRSTFLPPQDIERKPTSIGKAIPECEVFPLTADGRRANPGEPGILVHRGPTVSLGYWNRPEDTAKVWRPNPFRSREQGGDVVCYSGDIVTEDDEGYLFFVGRNDEMIKSAGYRISPSEVEEVLMASGAFAQVAVIGLPDEWIGQKVHAVGVPAASSDLAALPATSKLLQEIASHMPGYMVPKSIEWVDALPVTPNGKIDYKGLVAERKGLGGSD